MIKRKYFLAGKIYHDDGSKTIFFRYFWRKSLFANADLAIKNKMQSVANDNGVNVSDLTITAFNRC